MTNWYRCQVGSMAVAGNLALEDRSAVQYQLVCSQFKADDDQIYLTYGLQCMERCMGTWVQLDLLEDISIDRDYVLALAERFTQLQLSPLHFRDAVLDSVSA